MPPGDHPQVSESEVRVTLTWPRPLKPSLHLRARTAAGLLQRLWCSRPAFTHLCWRKGNASTAVWGRIRFVWRALVYTVRFSVPQSFVCLPTAPFACLVMELHATPRKREAAIDSHMLQPGGAAVFQSFVNCSKRSQPFPLFSVLHLTHFPPEEPQCVHWCSLGKALGLIVRFFAVKKQVGAGAQQQNPVQVEC